MFPINHQLYLLNQLEIGGPGRETLSLDLSVTRGVIASRLNLTQDHFSRILHELSDVGLIQVNGLCLTIPSLECLSTHQFE